jgi:hypothetical protein
MYLFTRRTRLTGGTDMAGVEWAGSICAKVKELTGQEIDLWATVYSSGFGTVSWTGWFDDLTALEVVGDKLEADDSWAELSKTGTTLTEGGLDDGLYQPLYGEPTGSPVQYVGGVTAVAASGHTARALAAGAEIARKARSITGLSTMFVRSVTGAYGEVGWLTGYEDAGQMEKADSALAGDPSWVDLLDSTKGCFMEDASATRSTIYRRLG